jgi:hypothetical protein
MGLRASHRRRVFFSAVFASVAVLTLARAGASQAVAGRVFAESSFMPIEGATLLLSDGDDNVVVQVITDGRGSFEILSPSAGPYTLEVYRLGFAQFRSEPLDLSNGATVEVQILLGIEAIPLAPLRVVARSTPAAGRLAGFRQRMNDPSRVGGYFITEEDIARRPMSEPSELVLQAPGVGLARMRGGLDRGMIVLEAAASQCVARLFLDGVRVQQTADHTIDDLLTTKSLAGVEVYPRALTAPIQYQDATPPLCGVVLFWSREGTRASPSSSFKRILIGSTLILGIAVLGFTTGDPP